MRKRKSQSLTLNLSPKIKFWKDWNKFCELSCKTKILGIRFPNRQIRVALHLKTKIAKTVRLVVVQEIIPEAAISLLIEVIITIAKILIILVKHLTREGLEILVPTTHIIKMHQMPVMPTKFLNSKIPTKTVLKTHSNREILLDLEQVASFVEK